MTNKEKYLISLVRNKEGDNEAIHYAKWRVKNKTNIKNFQLILIKLFIISDKIPFLKPFPKFLNKIYKEIINYLQRRSWKKSL